MKGAFIVIMLVLSLADESWRSYVCSCDEEASVESAIKYSDIVFKGTVLSDTVLSNLSDYGVMMRGDTSVSTYKWITIPVRVYTVKVDLVYKGVAAADTINVITSKSGTRCGFLFLNNKQYIIYGTANDDMFPQKGFARFADNNQTYWTNHCTRTKIWSQKEEIEIRKFK
jgi:hypothetical protein